MTNSKIMAMPVVPLKAATLEARIKDAISKRVEVQAEEHELLFHGVLHAKAYGDTTFIARMVNDMPNGVRVDAMLTWLREFFPVVAKAERDSNGAKVLNIHGRTRMVFKLAKKRDDASWKLADGWATPYFNFTLPKVETFFNVEGLAKVVENWLNKGEKKVGEGKFRGSKETFIETKKVGYAFLQELRNHKAAPASNAAQAA